MPDQEKKILTEGGAAEQINVSEQKSTGELVSAVRRPRMHYHGRVTQVLIYLGKFLRMFIYQNDWKVLPMAALIAGMVSVVIRRSMFMNMEGTLKGALALSCLAIWNGCFNSVQVVCRERGIIKREHRSGMHISSYVFAHMVYQALLCLMQTVLTIYVCSVMKVRFPEEGLFTPWFKADLGITIFLITYAADMMSLWISSLVHTAAAAMTLMPFILILQLTFSGGVFSLPGRLQGLSTLTISNWGLKCVASQAGYNDLPMMTAWNMLSGMEKEEVEVTMKLGNIFRFVVDHLEMDQPEEQPLAEDPTVKYLLEDPGLEDIREEPVTVKTTVGEIIDAAGKEKTKETVIQKTSAANRSPVYDNTFDNILSCWGNLFLFAIAFAALSVLTLEFIDKDRR
ncbi:MAG: ABC transporter permease [Stomatobaculum sp.]|nr:ABC transporter permease [Stomatobaculum sp.]